MVDRSTPPEAPCRTLGGIGVRCIGVRQQSQLYTQALHQSALPPEQAEADVARFIDLLLDATRTSPCTVVLTVRVDFYGEFLKHGPLAAAVPPGQVNLGPMRREGLAAAIQKPAEAIGLTVDPPLLEELLDEVCDDLGKLPLLEYALKETWRGREGQRLTLNAYGQAGGLDGAVAKRANDIFTHLRPAEQAAARRLFVSLVTPGEGREDTRARAVYPEQDKASRAVVRAFSAAEARLLVTGGDTPSAQRLVEISHEALIREWDLLKTWIGANREALRRREHIRARMRQWEEQDRDKTLLLPPGLPLEEGRKLLADHGDVLIEEVQPYITASIAADEERLRQEEAEAEAERQRDLAAAQRLVSEQRKRARLAIGLVLVMSLLAVAAGWQWLSARRSEQRAQGALTKATALKLAIESKTILNGSLPGGTSLGLQLALASFKLAPGPDTFGAIQSAENATAAVLWIRESNGPFAFSPDGRRIASGSSDGRLQIWDVAGGMPLGKSLKGHSEAISSIAFSPNGERIVSGSLDKTLQLWDAATGTPLGEPLKGHSRQVTGVAFSPDGKLIVSGGHDQTLRLWDAATGTPLGEPLKGHHGAVFGVGFSPDSTRIVSGSKDTTIRLWRVGRPERLCARLGRNLSSAEWKQYVGDIPYVEQCPGLPVD